MELNALKAFVEVAKESSFSKASEKLFLTQPAISKRIASLEDELDTKLFDRLGKKVFLTETGNKLLPKAIDILNQANDITRLASNLEHEVKGKLTIGTSHHIGLHRLPPVLKAFIKEHPEVQLDIKFMDSEEACHGVEMGDLEMAVVTLPQLQSSKLSTQLIWPDPLSVLVNTEHPLTELKKVSMQQLAKFPAIIPGKGTYTREILDNAFNEYSIDLNIAMATNYLETIKMLTIIGIGWTLLPESMQNKELKKIHVTGLKLHRSLGIVTHKARTLSNPAMRMIDTCLKHAQK